MKEVFRVDIEVKESSHTGAKARVCAGRRVSETYAHFNPSKGASFEPAKRKPPLSPPPRTISKRSGAEVVASEPVGGIHLN